MTATIAVFLALGGVAFAVSKVPKKSVGTRQLKNGAVSAKKLKNQAVTNAKLGGSAVGNSKLASGAVTGTKIAAGAVGTSQLADGSVTRSKVSDDAIPFLGTLRSGQTLRGMFDLGEHADNLSDATIDSYSFPFPLLNTPNVELLAPNNTSVNCPGITGGNQQTPQAQPGFLCVYRTQTGNLGTLGSSTTSRLGFSLLATPLATGQDYEASGFWAVTAP